MPLSDYQDKYSCINFERRDEILKVTLHTEGGSLRWGMIPHRELSLAFFDIANDLEVKAVILTGVGDEFSGPQVAVSDRNPFPNRPSMHFVDTLMSEGKQLLLNFLAIDVPVISALNGPVWRHGEFPLLADIVIASDTVAFQDSAHFPGGLVPGDGVHIVFPLLMGVNRARYFLLTGQIIRAQEALELGLISEIVSQDKVLDRAWELASDLSRKPKSLLRATRQVLTEDLKRKMQELLPFGLHTQMLAAQDID